MNRVCKCGLDSYGSRQGPVAGSCEHDYESSGYIKFLFFIEQSDNQFNKIILLCVLRNLFYCLQEVSMVLISTV
jgi:hypothetical protein